VAFRRIRDAFSVVIYIIDSLTQDLSKIPNQEFPAPPSYEEIVTFIKELGHKSDIKSVTDVVVDQMHQSWRTLASIINKCISGKITDSFESEYESWGDSHDDNYDDDQQSDDERPEYNDDDTAVNINKTNDEEDDEFVHTPKHKSKGKYDEEIIVVGQVNAEHKEVYQEVVEATTSTTTATDSTTLTVIHQSLSDVDNEVKTLRNVDHSSTIHAAVKSKVPTIVKEYIGTSLDDALHKALQRHTTELMKEHSILADFTDVLQQQPKPQKCVAHIRKIRMEQVGKQQEHKYTIVSSDHKALYHALMESILEDEHAIDKGVTDKLKKRKLDDDIDEGPLARLDQGLKMKKTCKETKPSKNAKSTRTSKGTRKSQPKSTGKIGSRNQKELLLQILCGIKISDLTQDILSPVKEAYEKHALLEEIEVRRSDQKLYKIKEGDFP
nr:hypothetical protein [Tanacetum cinerariifolium]